MLVCFGNQLNKFLVSLIRCLFFHAAIDWASIRTARRGLRLTHFLFPPDGQHTFAVAPFVGRVKPRAKNYLSNVEVMYRQGKKKIDTDA